MDQKLNDEIEDQIEWARQEVISDRTFFGTTSEGPLAAIEAASTTRLLVLTLRRVDRLDKNQNQVVFLLRVIAVCLAAIAYLLALSM
jgi:hypothetical protein